MGQHHGYSQNTQPVGPESAGACCVWCGQDLPVNCPSDDFGSDTCEAKWMAWRNQVVPIEVPKPAEAAPPPGGLASLAAAWYGRLYGRGAA